jgi:hypothetical protein
MLRFRNIGCAAALGVLAMACAPSASEARCRGGSYYTTYCCGYNSYGYSGPGSYYGRPNIVVNPPVYPPDQPPYNVGRHQCSVTYFAHNAWFTVDALVPEPNAILGSLVSVEVPRAGSVTAWILEIYQFPKLNPPATKVEPGKP